MPWASLRRSPSWATPGPRGHLLACIIGAVVCLPWTGELVTVVRDSDASTLWWIAYLGIFPTAVAFSTWAYCLARSDAGTLTLTTFLGPFIATLIAWALLSEAPPPLTFVGGALCIAGVLLSAASPGPSRSPTSEVVEFLHAATGSDETGVWTTLSRESNTSSTSGVGDPGERSEFVPFLDTWRSSSVRTATAVGSTLDSSECSAWRTGRPMAPSRPPRRPRRPRWTSMPTRCFRRSSGSRSRRRASRAGSSMPTLRCTRSRSSSSLG